ncbi:MAG: hypothetical protein K5864_07490 [Bacteroidales bacterium]|nr:hypothetical protein [Bacteroidales bacterium]
MKKVFFTLAIAAMFSFVACNNNTEATPEEETPIENAEENIDEACANAEENLEAAAEDLEAATDEAQAAVENL